jgi:tetratricopeptide (TPR) repeat protein
MPLNLSLFNTKTHFDSDLNDVADNTHEMSQACLEIKNYLKINNIEPLERASLLALLGSFQRILKNLLEAEICHLECLQLLKAHQAAERRILASNLRLAHVYQWQKRFQESNQLFTQTLSALEASQDQEMLSFGLQHFGKNLFDQNRYHEALECFERALIIRQNLKDEDLMESTRLSIKETLKKISKA